MITTTIEDIFSRNVPGIRELLKDKHIGIAGCGGLGSNLAVNLVRMGAENLTLVDLDKIEASNLNRQHYFADQIGMEKTQALRTNLLRINPEVKLTCHQLRLDESNIAKIFDDREVVAECFDGAENKALLTGMLAASAKLVVAVSGLAGTASAEKLKIKRPIRNLVVIGDGDSPDCREGLLSPRVSVAAAHQAWAILDHFLKEGRSCNL
ncbi:MAG: sulfur carrier protein ThiS adenylyltransferase ThiF [Candidatus Margulisiibacteriota bacterium]|nr:sulfur carrier protein ThiS adenylyltransferase ThiF [Candidatus Margulisiibacteriota bacterium]